jgi:branched-chain amino acid transport system ATP-binding protein
VLEISELTVRFGGVTPLNAATLRFERGICGLIGPNGAGKTTLLNVLSGFTRPAVGSARCDGEELLRMPAAARARWGVRRTFQREQIVAELTVRDNVRVAAVHTGGRRRAAIEIDEALELVGLQERACELPLRLTTMERKLLEIARAIVGRPRIVLLDEPGAGLSGRESARLLELLRAAEARSGALIVLIDHDMDLVRAACATVAVLDFGQVIGQGPTEAVLADPRVRRAYIGTEEVT